MKAGSAAQKHWGLFDERLLCRRLRRRPRCACAPTVIAAPMNKAPTQSAGREAAHKWQPHPFALLGTASLPASEGRLLPASAPMVVATVSHSTVQMPADVPLGQRRGSTSERCRSGSKCAPKSWETPMEN